MNIRPAQAADRDRVRRILTAVARFTEDEIRWAMDLVDKIGLEKPASWVGTGPYILKDWRPGVGFTFERNPTSV